ncbi:hypothetical protein ACFL6I_02115 [candidate division KSB1 bacterium]
MEQSGSTGGYRRLHITLPEETVELIKKVSKKPRSTFINEAVNFYGKVLQKVALKKRLKDGYNKPGE